MLFEQKSILRHQRAPQDPLRALSFPLYKVLVFSEESEFPNSPSPGRSSTELQPRESSKMSLGSYSLILIWPRISH